MKNIWEKPTWIDNDRFQHVKKYLELLCEKYGVPVPSITQCLYVQKFTECDHVSIERIVLYCKNDEFQPSYKEHAIRVFGHYLCALQYGTVYSEMIIRLITKGIEI